LIRKKKKVDDESMAVTKTITECNDKIKSLQQDIQNIHALNQRLQRKRQELQKTNVEINVENEKNKHISNIKKYNEKRANCLLDIQKFYEQKQNKLITKSLVIMESEHARLEADHAKNKVAEIENSFSNLNNDIKKSKESLNNLKIEYNSLLDECNKKKYEKKKI